MNMVFICTARYGKSFSFVWSLFNTYSNQYSVLSWWAIWNLYYST